jgi:hypothetical protein
MILACAWGIPRVGLSLNQCERRCSNARVKYRSAGLRWRNFSASIALAEHLPTASFA